MEEQPKTFYVYMLNHKTKNRILIDHFLDEQLAKDLVEVSNVDSQFEYYISTAR